MVVVEDGDNTIWTSGNEGVYGGGYDYEQFFWWENMWEREGERRKRWENGGNVKTKGKRKKGRNGGDEMRDGER